MTLLQMCILDGNAYDAKCLEAGQEREEDLDGCSLLLNNKVCWLLPLPACVYESNLVTLHSLNDLISHGGSAAKK